jgi:hypothetical protein
MNRLVELLVTEETRNKIKLDKKGLTYEQYITKLINGQETKKDGDPIVSELGVT